MDITDDDVITSNDVMMAAIHMRKGSWTMASSLSHLTNLNTCHVGITDFWKTGSVTALFVLDLIYSIFLKILNKS
jgi:hypothetical protein